MGPRASLSPLLQCALRSVYKYWMSYTSIKDHTTLMSTILLLLCGFSHAFGAEDSWAKLTKTYAEQGTAVADAADKKDAKALGTATKAISSGCKTWSGRSNTFGRTRYL